MPRSARLEIHQINVGQGDSILIVNRDLDAVKAAIGASKGAAVANGLEPIDYLPYAVANDISLEGTIVHALLIDAGDDEYGGDVLNYLETQGALRTAPAPFCPDLYVLPTHFHADHAAGLRHIFKEAVPVTVTDEDGRLVRRIQLQERYRPARIYRTTADDDVDPLEKVFYNGLVADFSEAMLAPANNSELIQIDPGGFEEGDDKMLTIDLGAGVEDIPITLYTLAAGQGVYDSEGTYTEIDSVDANTIDPNDRSVVLVLEYGSFRYFLGGDIGGNGLEPGGNEGDNAMDADGKPHTSRHADVETTLGPAIEGFFPATEEWEVGEPKYPSDGYCTVFKANHHASSSSCDVHFMSSIVPDLAIISSGVRSRFHHHPTQEVINRMSDTETPDWGLSGTDKTTENTIEQVYVTEVADRVKGKAFATDLRGAKILGDIVIRPVDETILALQSAGEEDHVGGVELEVQIYGSGEQTSLADPTTTLRPTEAKNGGYAAYSLIGPFYHSINIE